MDEAVKQVRKFTNDYINQYALDEQSKNVANSLNTTTTKYIRDIFENQEGINSFYLKGSRGSGKYQYIEKLSEHFKKIFKNFTLENIFNCNTYVGLLGDSNNPGELLKVITKIRKKNQLGIIMVDSAEAFEPALKSAIQSLFNNTKLDFKPAYLKGNHHRNVPVSLKGLMLVLMDDSKDMITAQTIPVIKFPENINQDHQEKILEEYFSGDPLLGEIRSTEEFKEELKDTSNITEFHFTLQRLMEKTYTENNLDTSKMAFPDRSRQNSGLIRKNSLYGDDEFDDDNFPGDYSNGQMFPSKINSPAGQTWSLFSTSAKKKPTSASPSSQQASRKTPPQHLSKISSLDQEDDLEEGGAFKNHQRKSSARQNSLLGTTQRNNFQGLSSGRNANSKVYPLRLPQNFTQEPQNYIQGGDSYIEGDEQV